MKLWRVSARLYMRYHKRDVTWYRRNRMFRNFDFGFQMIRSIEILNVTISFLFLFALLGERHYIVIKEMAKRVP